MPLLQLITIISITNKRKKQCQQQSDYQMN